MNSLHVPPGRSDTLYVGIGGAGMNILKDFVLWGARDGLAMSTDATSLARVDFCPILPVPATPDQRPRTKAELAHAAAMRMLPTLCMIMKGYETVVILAGLGGGMGSAGAPLVALEARALGASVLAAVTLPFSFEGNKCRDMAAHSLARLEDHADSVFVFHNDDLRALPEHENVLPHSLVSKVTLPQAFSWGHRQMFLAVQAHWGKPE